MQQTIDGDYIVTTFPSGATARELRFAPAAVPIRVITKLAYMNRFTDAELAGIYTAAKSVVQVEIWLEKFKLAQEIDLDDPSTAVGLQAMESAELIGVGRTAEILT